MMTPLKDRLPLKMPEKTENKYYTLTDKELEELLNPQTVNFVKKRVRRTKKDGKKKK